MPGYIKYSVLAFFAVAVVYFTANVVQAMALPDETAIDVLPPRAEFTAPAPDYLITDANFRPGR